MSSVYVLSVGRNAGDAVIRCMDSVQSQTILPAKHIVVDDISDDNTGQNIESYIDAHQIIEKRFNENRKYRLKNIYDNSVDKADDDIIMLLDNDDWFNNDFALELVLDEYQKNDNLELVYSRYIFSDGTLGGSAPIPNDSWNPYRSGWRTSHLCTYKAGLLKKIPLANFLDWNGSWFEIGTDQTMILPMLFYLQQRDGGFSSVGFVNSVLYVYNCFDNPNKPRFTPEAQALSDLSVRVVQYVRNRGFVNE